MNSAPLCRSRFMRRSLARTVKPRTQRWIVITFFSLLLSKVKPRNVVFLDADDGVFVDADAAFALSASLRFSASRWMSRSAAFWRSLASFRNVMSRASFHWSRFLSSTDVAILWRLRRKEVSFPSPMKLRCASTRSARVFALVLRQCFFLMNFLPFLLRSRAAALRRTWRTASFRSLRNSKKARLLLKKRQLRWMTLAARCRRRFSRAASKRSVPFHQRLIWRAAPTRSKLMSLRSGSTW
mmetsp:Transcript_36992/g.115858  ORF Transcript_36992/g.115858 Transcript_36992/m.115858 type:complete len:240 (-) Transcript_36992:1791-2510(-)